MRMLSFIKYRLIVSRIFYPLESPWNLNKIKAKAEIKTDL